MLCLGAVAFAPAAGAQDEAIKGTLINRDDQKPVEGVAITVDGPDGTELGSAQSDADGKFSIPVPGARSITVSIDPDTVPDGVKLSNPDDLERAFDLNPNQIKTVVFPFGDTTRQTVSTFDKLPALLLDGLRLGLIIAMTAIGLSLIYGTTQFTNFAHGEMVTFGALATWWLNQNAGLPLLLAAPIAIALSAVGGLTLDAALWTPLHRRSTSPFGLMVVSFGLSILLINTFQFFYGTRTQPYDKYVIQEPLFQLGNQNVPPKAMWSIGISVLTLVGVGLFLQKTRFGKAMRAVADNRALASASGIDTARVVRLVWIMGSALAGLGGILYSVDLQVKFDQGQSLLLLMFAGITLGGLGTSFGAAAGCVILGVAIQLSTLWIPVSLKNVGALVALIVVLMVRPQGVFGRKERVG